MPSTDILGGASLSPCWGGEIPGCCSYFYRNKILSVHRKNVSVLIGSRGCGRRRVASASKRRIESHSQLSAVTRKLQMRIVVVLSQPVWLETRTSTQWKMELLPRARETRFWRHAISLAVGRPRCLICNLSKGSEHLELPFAILHKVRWSLRQIEGPDVRPWPCGNFPSSSHIFRSLFRKKGRIDHFWDNFLQFEQ